MKNRKKLLALLLAAATAMTLLAGCGGAKKKDTVVILDGEFAEPEIVAQMAKMLIEDKTDLKAEVKDAMTPIYGFNEMNEGKIDLMLSYDGSLLVTFLKHDDAEVPAGMSTYDYAQQVAAKECKVHLLEKLGANNTYSIAVRRETAEKYNLKTVSDLVPVAGELVFGAEHKFFDEEGLIRYKPLCKFYGLTFKDAKSIDLNLKYSAIANGDIDVTEVYATDGQWLANDLVLLTDDKAFFPEYNLALLVRNDLFDEVKDTAPDLESVLNELAGRFTESEMAQLSYEVDVNKREPAEVAREWLVAQGLLQA